VKITQKPHLLYNSFILLNKSTEKPGIFRKKNAANAENSPSSCNQTKCPIEYPAIAPETEPRSKNRLKSFLQYFGISIPVEYDNNLWTLKYISWLKQIKMQTMSGQDAFSNLISSYEYHRQQLLTLSRQVRQRIREYDNELYSLLKTISGIVRVRVSENFKTV
jgi:hypothetical protein